MSLKILEVIVDQSDVELIVDIAKQHEVLDYWYAPESGEGRSHIRLLVRPEKRQIVMDALQSVLGVTENARVVIQPVEAVWPLPEKEPASEKSAETSRTQVTREELYSEIDRGARLDSNFFLLTFLSTVVASIGLIENSVAIIIGAMVIAPLLGPNIALALGTALGDSELMWRALKTNLSGIITAFILSCVIGYLWISPVDSAELTSRTNVGLDGIGLALASGAAAALSLTTGLSSVLVGVMVAVALLPPIATAGLMLGSEQYQGAIGAGLLLAVNIVCINLSAKLVFLFKGVRPRTWSEKHKASQSVRLYLAIWIISLLILAVIIYLRQAVVNN